MSPPNYQHIVNVSPKANKKTKINLQFISIKQNTLINFYFYFKKKGLIFFFFFKKNEIFYFFKTFF
jgi:hypothetical protein